MSDDSKLNRETTLRFALIGLTVLAMLIPLSLVDGVAEERQGYFDETLADIGASWGPAQRVVGPFLVVPLEQEVEVTKADGSTEVEQRRVRRVITPAELELDIQVDHQLRSRAIYEVPVYLAEFTFRGAFAELAQTDPRWTPRWEAARLVLGVSESKAISTMTRLEFGEDSVAFGAGSSVSWLEYGVHAPVAFDPSSQLTQFAFTLELKGTQRLQFTPVGRESTIQMQASWPHPGFGGAFLPERYTVSEDGFEAHWQVHELANALPGQSLDYDQAIDFNDAATTVELHQPITSYRVVERAIKYGLLFIALTFLGVLCFEFSAQLRFHPVQYAVVGAALVLFYLTFLSLSEHLSIGVAYLASTLVLTGLLTWYMWGMTRLPRLALSLAALVGILYAALYVLLQLQDFALLVGTAVLLAGLGALMFVTRTLTATPAET